MLGGASTMLLFALTSVASGRVLPHSKLPFGLNSVFKVFFCSTGPYLYFMEKG